MPNASFLRVGQVWPDGAEDNKFWIGADAMAAREQHPGPLPIGRFFKTADELREVANEMRTDLEAAIAEAARKFR